MTSQHTAARHDVAWATLLGVLAALSPHTSGARLVPSLIGGAVVAAATWCWRRDLIPGIAGFRAGRDGATGLDLHLTQLQWACVGACLLVQLPTLHWLYEQYTISIWRNGHGLFLGPILYVLVRNRLRAAPRPAIRGSAWGLPVLALAALLALIESASRLGYPGALGLVVALPGLSLLLLGTAATRRIAFPLCLGLFFLPTPEGMVDPFALASTTADLAAPLIRLTGLQATAFDTLVLFYDHIFNVSANCSGLSTFYSAVLLALILSARTPSWRTRTLIFAAIWPLTLLFNSVRLFVIIGGASRWGLAWVHSPIHGLGGIATFWAVMLSLAAAAWWMARNDQSRGGVA